MTRPTHTAPHGPQIESILQHAIDHSEPAPATMGGVDLLAIIAALWLCFFIAGIVVQRYFS